MKKALIPIILILAISLVPCVPAPSGLADPATSATSILASFLFWHLIDAFRTSELARMTAPARSSDAPESLTATAGMAMSIFVNFALEHSIAIDRTPSAPHNSCATVSISACLVRRIVEREIRTIREESAGRQPSRPDHHSDHDIDCHKEKS